MIGTQISDMTDSLAQFPSGSFVPFIVTDQSTGLDPKKNYRYDIGADLLTKVSYAALAAATGASLVGTTTGTVQSDLDIRPTEAELAAANGSSLVGFVQSGTGAVIRTALDKLRDFVSVLDYGAKGDGVLVADGAMSSGSATLNSATAGFTVQDIGKKISVAGAGVAGAFLLGTITARASSTQITVSVAASTTVSNAIVSFGTDDTAAIQSALDAKTNVYFPCGDYNKRRYMISALTMPPRSRWYGDGPQRSILRQFDDADANTPAVTLTGLNTLNIADGARVFEDIGIEVSSKIGIDASACTASMWRDNNLRLVQRINETLTVKPYPVEAGTVGILLDADTAPAAIYLGLHNNLEIRSFETAVKALGPVNEQQIRGWFIDCQYGLDLDGVSRWQTDISFESGVDNAIKYRFRTAISSSDFWGRCEIPVAESAPNVPVSSTDHYMTEFIGSVSMTNVNILDKPVLITQDGNLWPGRKYKGTLPDGVVYNVPLLKGGVLFDATLGKPTYTLFQGPPLYLGGASRGNGKITLGRNADDSTLFTIEHDGSQGVLDCPNGVAIAQTQGGIGYTKPFFIGAYAFWVDGSGLFRIKAGYPSSDTDGTIVGTQS